MRWYNFGSALVDLLKAWCAWPVDCRDPASDTLRLFCADHAFTRCSKNPDGSVLLKQFGAMRAGKGLMKMHPHNVDAHHSAQSEAEQAVHLRPSVDSPAD